MRDRGNQTQTPDEAPVAKPEPGPGSGEISNVWVVVVGVAIAALEIGTRELVQSVLDDPGWLTTFAVTAALNVPILVLALKLWLRRRVRAGHY